MKYLSFSVQLTSLSIIPSRSIHVVTNGKNSFFLWLSNFPLYIYIYISIYLYLSISIYIYTYIYIYISHLFPFAWNIFFHYLTFSMHESLALKWVSYKQHIDGSWVLFFLSNQPPYVFWLEHVVHWHLKSLLIGMYLVPFCYLFYGCFYSSLFFSSSVHFFPCGLVIFFSGMLVFLSL